MGGDLIRMLLYFAAVCGKRVFGGTVNLKHLITNVYLNLNTKFGYHFQVFKIVQCFGCVVSLFSCFQLSTLESES